jgi:ABC-type iron transport system FetAB ATPase subunit
MKEINEWILVDEEIQKMNKNLKELREKRHALETCILEVIKEKITPGKSFQTTRTDGSKQIIKMIKTNTYQPLTFRFIESSLSNILQNKEQINEIIHTLREKRQVIESMELKRI